MPRNVVMAAEAANHDKPEIALCCSDTFNLTRMAAVTPCVQRTTRP